MGTSENRFSPHSACTRGQIAMFLFRADSAGHLRNGAFVTDNRWRILAVIYRHIDAPECQKSYTENDIDGFVTRLEELPDTLRELSGGRMRIHKIDIVVEDTPIRSFASRTDKDGVVRRSLTHGEGKNINFNAWLDREEYDQVFVFAPFEPAVLGISTSWSEPDFTYKGRTIHYSLFRALPSARFLLGGNRTLIYGTECDLRMCPLIHELLVNVERGSKCWGWTGFIPVNDAKRHGYDDFAENADCGYLDWYSDLMRDAIREENAAGFRPQSFFVTHRDDGQPDDEIVTVLAGYTPDEFYADAWESAWSPLDSFVSDSVDWEGHRYQIFEDTGLTWEEAEARCEAMGGHLITITSNQEQGILKGLLLAGRRNSYWLGARYGQYRIEWVTGENGAVGNCQASVTPYPSEPGHAMIAYRNHNYDVFGKPSFTFGQWANLRASGANDRSGFWGVDNIGFICEWDQGGQ